MKKLFHIKIILQILDVLLIRKGILNQKVGLLTYDEAVYARAYPGKITIIYINLNDNYLVHMNYNIHPVISLKQGTTVTGSGTSTDPYVVK